MPEFLYRFRPLFRLLDHNELENQEIYFAAPKQLNDPMEGFRDIFWKGDSIVWRNFFRHYLICLDNAYTQFVLVGEQEPLSWDHIPILNDGTMNDGTPWKEAEQAIIDRFFAEPSVAELIDTLSRRNLPVRRNELAAHLRSIHIFALLTIRKVNAERGLEQWPSEGDEQLEHAKGAIATSVKALRQLEAFEARHSATEAQADELFASHNRLNTALQLINIYNQDATITTPNKNFLFFTFPSEYPIQIECLIYPDWYVACFMSECRNSAIWGTYGDSHTAICMKFKVTERENIGTLDLERQYGLGMTGPIVGYVPHSFHEVVYENKHEPVDFFRSIARFPESILRDNWYSDKDGNVSPCADEIFNDQDAWRDRYWKLFESGLVRKLDHWSQECEHRLILSGDLIDFSESANRVTKYRFCDLEGIIFGINTPLQKKIEIIKIIEAKCRKEGREAFRFYQARYKPSTGTIEHDEMPLLKFSR
ncbi:hypothetical protein SAMN02799636_05129 [Methylobacterium sp. 275MFSha3.1]|uniref:DUF2971 domain-containing protein n=1 Tax=Methylobacterium sp. 275MFSha3.1 TaxID=1502746 RepID=UPI0008A76275|nr:DUF2971 domain-containing protein [Methylobacterium sp. 275MFSha3.1]SEI04425.1 hypothetical protein SAMN02799636_05129 [Methylobacterium sp. 275MFSha3.1]